MALVESASTKPTVKRIDYNLKNCHGRTALIICVLRDQYDLAMKLIKVTDPNLVDCDGRTVLFHAMMSPAERRESLTNGCTQQYDLEKSVGLVKKLIKHKADCNVVDLHKQTPLWIAIRSGVKQYIDLMIQHSNLNIPNRYGQSVLNQLILEEKYQIALQVVELANPDFQDPGGYTALMLLFRSRCLLNKTDLLPDEQKNVRLLICKLLEREANCNLQTNSTKQFALMFAVWTGVKEYVDLLLPHTDPNLIDSDGQNILHELVSENSSLDMNQFIKFGVNPNTISNKDLTPLMLAIISECYDQIDILIQHSNINLRNKDGKTAIYYAVRLREDVNTIEIVRKLIKAGADLNLQYDNDYTILMKACMIDHMLMANELITQTPTLVEPVTTLEYPHMLLEINKTIQVSRMTLTFQEPKENYPGKIIIPSSRVNELDYLLTKYRKGEEGFVKFYPGNISCGFELKVRNNKMFYRAFTDGVSLKKVELPPIIKEYFTDFARCCFSTKCFLSSYKPNPELNIRIEHNDIVLSAKDHLVSCDQPLLLA